LEPYYNKTYNFTLKNLGIGKRSKAKTQLNYHAIARLQTMKVKKQMYKHS